MVFACRGAFLAELPSRDVHELEPVGPSDLRSAFVPPSPYCMANDGNARNWNLPLLAVIGMFDLSSGAQYSVLPSA